tara:strand:- start:19460 stop:21616 length:2157 start_codon:yes stop_codon:yes gene_type:complete
MSHPALNTRIDGDVCIIEINVPDESQNTLDQSIAEHFSEALLECIQADHVNGVIITSTKKDSFIAGADVRMFDQLDSVEEACRVSAKAQEVFAQIETLSLPVVAAIDGTCLGGGLELALACQARVCSDNPKTRLGLPEVQLGILPGGGGTQRLTRQVGIRRALDLMLTGRQLRCKQALKMGLIDEIVPSAHLITAAKRWIERLNHPQKPSWSKKAKSYLSSDYWIDLALEKNPYGRRFLFTQARDKTLAKTKGLFPAPERIIDVVETAFESDAPVNAGYEAEKTAFGQLIHSPQSRALVGLFRHSTALKKATYGNKQPAVTNVGVLGAGLMGAGIAYVSVANAKVRVRLKDRDEQGLAAGIRYQWNCLKPKLKRRFISPLDVEKHMAMLTPTTDYSGFASADIVIEAVFEDLELKHQMLKDIEQVNPNAIFASNTSSIPISRIAEKATNPQNVVGMHYFSPVEKMPLLEIITTEHTSPEVVQRCVDFGHQQGKVVIVVNDGPGFYTSRILVPYLNEAANLLLEGYPIDDIDHALVECGFPVGPFALLDEVGIDVAMKIAPIMEQAFPERMQVCSALVKLAEDGRKGRKNKRGFYRYDVKPKKGQKPVDESIYKLLNVELRHVKDRSKLAQRCILAMINEAIYCLEDGTLSSATDGDIGAVFGLGFPPGKGGPFKYVDIKGARQVVEALEQLSEEVGPRFTPAQRLLTHYQRNQRFYGR